MSGMDPLITNERAAIRQEATRLWGAKCHRYLRIVHSAVKSLWEQWLRVHLTRWDHVAWDYLPHARLLALQNEQLFWTLWAAPIVFSLLWYWIGEFIISVYGARCSQWLLGPIKAMGDEGDYSCFYTIGKDTAYPVTYCKFTSRSFKVFQVCFNLFLCISFDKNVTSEKLIKGFLGGSLPQHYYIGTKYHLIVETETGTDTDSYIWLSIIYAHNSKSTSWCIVRSGPIDRRPEGRPAQVARIIVVDKGRQMLGTKHRSKVPRLTILTRLGQDEVGYDSGNAPPTRGMVYSALRIQWPLWASRFCPVYPNGHYIRPYDRISNICANKKWRLHQKGHCVTHCRPL